MNREYAASLILLSVIFSPMSFGSSSVKAQELTWPFKIIAEPFRARHREQPQTCADDSIEQLAREIDWLEHHIDKYGTIVAKHPDIWGESRLMRHRYEYEQQMAAQLEHFEVRMNAALRRSDQAYLGMAFALQAAAGNTTSGTPVPTPTTTDVQANLNLLNALVPDPNASVPTGQAAIIDRSKPFGLGADAAGFTFEQDKLSLEPTIQLDQMSRYLNHLHELRRINEGDDIADSPGYSLNLVRIPVSVLPGNQTRKGYGAEITIIAEPYLGEDLLPTTFRNLVISDLVDLLSPALTSLVNNPRIVAYADSVVKMQEEAMEQHQRAMEMQQRAMEMRRRAIKERDNVRSAPPGPEDLPPPAPDDLPQLEPLQTPEAAANRAEETAKIAAATANKTAATANKAVADLLTAIQSQIPNLPPELVVPSSKICRARLPLPPSQIPEVFGPPGLAPLIVELHRGLSANTVNRPVIHYMDVRSYMNEELQAACEFLSGDKFQELWVFCGHPLATAIRERRAQWLDTHRCKFFNRVGVDDGRFPESGLPDLPPCVAVEDAAAPESMTATNSNCFLKTKVVPDICKKATAALSWAIVVESSLLNERLIQDMREASTARGYPLYTDQVGPFFGPHPSEEARMAFNEYVKCRWPIRVFALDPVTQDQNVADAFARRRETQVAIALAFASGQMNAQSLMRFTRRLEWDMATIDLNRTVVSFSHGNDTFGWRFHPRFQTPPIKGNLATLGETLFGGPTEESDLRQRELEAGQRECTAIVVMPSFVPYVTFDVRTNWFCLTHPKQTELSMKDTMVLSRSIKSMQQSAAMCAPCAHLYRDGEVQRLLRRVDQLDRELPLQTLQAQIPYENTAGGFELFNNGITDLAPELIGWYGAPGINPNGSTTMYLVGDGFSVHDTRLIAGGRVVPFILLSRQVMQVEIPTGVQVLRVRPDEDNFDEVVDLHLATPYGVSSHLLVPLAKPGAGLSGSTLAWKPGAKIDISATVTKGTTPTGNVNSFFQSQPNELVISFPSIATVPATPTFILNVRHGNVNLGGFSHTAVAFDARTNEFYITGDHLTTLVGAAANAELTGRVEPYLVHLFGQQSGTGKQLVNLTVEGLLQMDNNRRPVPVAGSFEVVVDVEVKQVTPP